MERLGPVNLAGVNSVEGHQMILQLKLRHLLEPGLLGPRSRAKTYTLEVSHTILQKGTMQSPILHTNLYAHAARMQLKWYGLERCARANVIGRESPHKVYALKRHCLDGRTSTQLHFLLKIVFGRKSGTAMAVPAVTVPTPLACNVSRSAGTIYHCAIY